MSKREGSGQMRGAAEMNLAVRMLFCHPFLSKATIHHLDEDETKTQVMPRAKVHTAQWDQKPVSPGPQAGVLYLSLMHTFHRLREGNGLVHINIVGSKEEGCFCLYIDGDTEAYNKAVTSEEAVVLSGTDMVV